MYLLTNGLGGFSSCTMAGSVTRNDHALLMACVKAPNHRYNMVHRLKEEVVIAGKRNWISSQQFADGSREEGYRSLSAFSFEDVPMWRYQVQGVEIVKCIGMRQDANQVAVTYDVCNRGREAAEISVTPFFQFVRKGGDLEPEQEFAWEGETIRSEGLAVSVKTNGSRRETGPVYETYQYAYDACDGRRACGQAVSFYAIGLNIPGGGRRRLELVCSMEEPVKETGAEAEEIVKETIAFRKELEALAGFQAPVAAALSKSAAQFISRRESTGGDTILAGYPFFEDWGRDTMIALPGCALAVKRYETAKSILRTFMEHEQKGLMPNLFPEGENEPAYNTVDAALLFINCVYLYVEQSGDRAFLEEAYPVMEHIISWYRRGTDYGIHMDEDGLVMAGEGLDQVTWMDVRVGDILPTPRHGKPVEVNAYWYNALRIMEKVSAGLGKPGDYGAMAEKARESFRNRFWMEEKHCLKDVVSGGKADNQIRCNQIWAVSLPFTMLDREQELQVVETVFEKLYTPYGLRTLEPEDEEFRPSYGGEQLGRDLAYHQGTVWTFPLGAYYLAYLKVHDYKKEAVEQVKTWLEPMECALREGCIGQLPEIYDGGVPTSSRGCFAQAWSVGEILRVYEAIEQR